MAHARNDTPSYINLGDCDQRYTHLQQAYAVSTNRNSSSINTHNLSSNTTDARDDTPSYMDLGDCDQQCRHRGCLFADTVCRVFEQKVKDYLRFLKEVKTFGYVSVVLYTIEFQKRGLLHCHTLLWIESRNTLKDATQIDEYISTEIPDPVQDPRGYKLVTELMMHGPCGSANLDASYRILAKISNSETSTSTVGTSKQIDEIQNYVDGRLHTEDMQHINFHERDRLDIIVNIPEKKKKTLTEWFVYDNENSDGRHLTRYLLLPNATVSSKRCKSPDEVRTVNGQMLPTFRAACEALGLLGDDKEWDIALEEFGLTSEEHKRSETFAKWLFEVGDGNIGEPEKEDQDSSWITIPPEYSVDNEETSLSKLINFIYDDTTLKTPTAGSLQEKAIVCPKNATVDDVNAKILSNIEGQRKIYLINDEAILMGSETELLYPTEYLNTITFLGFPPHELELKVRPPIMLLCNVNLSGGLCNGIRMIVRCMMSKLIEAQIITGTRVGKKVFIHRISLTHKDPNLSFTFKRTQFPVKLCYSMTINKSKGKSLSKIGIYLPELVLAMDNYTEEHKRSETFAKWLFEVGDGNIGEPEEEDQDSSWITIPPEYSVDNEETSLSKLINFIYDDTTLKTPTAGSLQEKAIVCPKNATVDDVNAKILSNIEGQRKIYLINDEAILMGSETELLYPTEYLNTITFLGFPPHELELKVRPPIMLLCNVNLSGGLCNGIRMIVRCMMSKLIEAQIITGTRVGKKVFIHRIPLTHKDPNLSFTFKRT
nr:ATP-dependent DNA helicase PIF1-like [Tanacetum cinerariifolium]